MNPLALCLSIVPVASSSHTPAPVVEIVQSHIAREFKRERPNWTVNFDIASCPNILHYEEGLTSLKIFGETSHWRGEKQIDYTDALAQRSLNFNQNIFASEYDSKFPNPGPKRHWRPWLLWTGAGLIAGGVIYYQVRKSNRNHHKTSNSDTANLATGIRF